MGLTKKQKDIMEKTETLLESLNLREDEDYKINLSKVINTRTKTNTTYLNIRFREKSNKHIVEALEGIGWQKDGKFRNSDGNLSFFASDEFGGEFIEQGVSIVKMKYEI